MGVIEMACRTQANPRKSVKGVVVPFPRTQELESDGVARHHDGDFVMEARRMPDGSIQAKVMAEGPKGGIHEIAYVEGCESKK